MFISVGYILEYCGEGNEVVLVSLCLFVIMFNSRLAIDEYSNRFFHDDVFHRVVYFVYTYGVMVMTFNINFSGSGYTAFRGRSLYSQNDIGDCAFVEDYWEGISYGFFITRMSLITLYSLVCYHNEDARRQFGIYVIRHTISLLVILFTFKTKAKYLTAFTVALLVEVVGSIAPKCHGILKDSGYGFFESGATFPIDIYDYQNRLGIFFLMALGESMIQLLTPIYNTQKTPEIYKYLS